MELEAPRVVEENEPLVREILLIGFVALQVSLFDERPAVWQLGELTRLEGRSVGLSGSIPMHVLPIFPHHLAVGITGRDEANDGTLKRVNHHERPPLNLTE